MSILATNIQRFSLHDGPGIRTTVFLKGCSLHCPWCANPENIKGIKEKYVKNGREGIYGREYTTQELYEEILKDKAFYDGDFYADDIEKMPGGVTFSGGEALLQAEELESLWYKLKKEKIHMAVETCLFVPAINLELAINYLDLFYVDMKILDENKSKACIGGNLNVYYDNLSVLLSSNKPLVIRIPLIGGFTDDVNNRKKIIQKISEIKDKIKKVEIIKEHNLGEYKYISLGLNVPAYNGISDELLEKFKNEISEMNVNVEVCKI